jgi:hypothetical protein
MLFTNDLELTSVALDPTLDPSEPSVQLFEECLRSCPIHGSTIYARINEVHEGQMDKKTLFSLIAYVVRAVLDCTVCAWLVPAGGRWRDKSALSRRRLAKYKDGICLIERKKDKERKILDKRYWGGASGVLVK